ncbi:hypothetical protein ACH4TP_37695 [Streptomyces sp. NPDC021012]|uniref:hypothetical protein n=1 Tax=Streptomyces sp. NPDC021012 TaxID=3365107 RepID=UPI0037A0139C
MRRPTQHSARTPRGTWSHPYTGIQGLAVFYNDGGAPTPGSPSNPAAPPATFVAPPATPPTPAASAADDELVISQDQLSALAAKEKAQGERSGARKALEKFAADNGFSTVEDAQTFITAARKAHEDALTEEQKRAAELDRREQELAAREAAAAKAQRDADRRSALAGLGATGDDLTDALALLQAGLADDTDAVALTAAAEALKARRPELFGTPQTPATPLLPPAPAGAPAGGPPARQSGGEKPGSRGLEMARLRGHRTAA